MIFRPASAVGLGIGCRTTGLARTWPSHCRAGPLHCRRRTRGSRDPVAAHPLPPAPGHQGSCAKSRRGVQRRRNARGCSPVRSSRVAELENRVRVAETSSSSFGSNADASSDEKSLTVAASEGASARYFNVTLRTALARSVRSRRTKPFTANAQEACIAKRSPAAAQAPRTCPELAHLRCRGSV